MPSLRSTAAVFIEHYKGRLLPHVKAVFQAARQLSPDKVIGVLAVGEGNSDALIQESKSLPMKSLMVAKNAAFEHSLPEAVAPLLEHLQRESIKAEYWLTGHSSIGRNVFPRFAALLPTACAISDVTGIVDGETFVRPIYAGTKERFRKFCN